MTSGFNLTVTRREKRQMMKLCSGLPMICDSTWPVSRSEMREETRSDGRHPLSAISATRDVNDTPVLGNAFQCCLLVSRIMFFPLLLYRGKRIEIIIKIKANFLQKRLLSLRFSSLLLEIKSVNKYSIFLYDKHTRAVNLTRAIKRGMICFLFPTHQAVK